MQLNDEQFTQELDYSIGSIRNQVVHVMSATQRGMKRAQGVEVPLYLPFDDYTTRAAAKAKWDEMRIEMLDYIYTLNQPQLDEVVHWEIPTRRISADSQRWELLTHRVNHATDHRAQILAMLHCHFGVKTVEHDLIFYLAEAQ